MSQLCKGNGRTVPNSHLTIMAAIDHAGKSPFSQLMAAISFLLTHEYATRKDRPLCYSNSSLAETNLTSSLFLNLFFVALLTGSFENRAKVFLV